MALKEYIKPETLNDALLLLSENQGRAKLIAGGTDVMVQLHGGKIDPEILISVDLLPELHGISITEDNEIRIGAATDIAEVTANEHIRKYAAALSEAAGSIGCHSIRNVATIGGNLVNASPVSDTMPPVCVLDGSVELVSLRGTRRMPLDEFELGLGKTAIEADEILQAIYIPIKEHSGSNYQRFGRRKAMELAIVSVACAVDAADDGTCERAKLAIGAVMAKPHIVAEFADGMQGKKLAEVGEDFIQKIAELAESQITPRSSVRASAEVKKNAAKVMTKRAIEAAIKGALS